MSQLTIHPDHATDDQLREAAEYHKKQWLRLCDILRNRREKKKFRDILSCTMCTAGNELCDKHK